MRVETGKKKWWEVYDVLAKALLGYYEKGTNSRYSPGYSLYRLLKSDEEFVRENKWIEKFSIRSRRAYVDPIHIFASFNHSSSNDEKRIKRIRIIIRLLELDYHFSTIDFSGCPTPQTIRILSFRPGKESIEIWDAFLYVYRQGHSGLNQKHFYQMKKWYGLDTASFTIFLYWIRSDEFLPLDHNTTTFIKNTGIYPFRISNIEEYRDLLDSLNRYNINYTDIYYSDRGLFREFAAVAYKVISLGDNSHKYSRVLNDILGINKDTVSSRDVGPSAPPYSKTIVHRDIKPNTFNAAKIGFKIIALKPLSNCNKDYLNNLKPNKTYYFDKSFTITTNQIRWDAESPYELYNIRDNNQNLNIGVGAIVGRNGSGKSSLIELIYRIINNVGCKFRKELKTPDLIVEKGLHAALYFIADTVFYRLEIRDEKIKLFRYTYDGENLFSLPEMAEFEFKDYNNWFYSIAVNYSHYALNSNDLGQWIENLFHKNDGYQTPLVINPKRTEGNIDINVENKLVISRLISNLLRPINEDDKSNIRHLTESQEAYAVDYVIKDVKNKFLYETGTGRNKTAVYFKNIRLNRKLIITAISSVFELDKESILANQNPVINTVIDYILAKLIRISTTYTHYNWYFSKGEKRFRGNEINIERYLTKLRDDKSHVTFKLKQAINYLKYPELYPRNGTFRIEIKEQSDKLSRFLSEHPDINLIELLPPSLFVANIELRPIGSKKSNTSSFKKLSSGEKQMIHSVNSILYHLYNIDSVTFGETELTEYTKIALILDEIEIYYHPEMQKRYLNYLLEMLSKVTLTNINDISILLITHSPYILSDIPDTYILKLSKGVPEPHVDGEETFAANVHDLLANDFFMNDGFMGSFAKRKINSVVEFLKNVLKPNPKYQNTDNWTKEKVKKFINIIGEPLIHSSLEELYIVAYEDEVYIDVRIEHLRNLKMSME